MVSMVLGILVRSAKLKDDFGGERPAWLTWRFGRSSARHD